MTVEQLFAGRMVFGRPAGPYDDAAKDASIVSAAVQAALAAAIKIENNHVPRVTSTEGQIL